MAYLEAPWGTPANTDSVDPDSSIEILLLAIWNKKCRPPCPVNQNPRNAFSIRSHSVDRRRVGLSICLESMLVQVPAELVETGLMSLPLHLGPF